MDVVENLPDLISLCCVIDGAEISRLTHGSLPTDRAPGNVTPWLGLLISTQEFPTPLTSISTTILYGRGAPLVDALSNPVKAIRTAFR